MSETCVSPSSPVWSWLCVRCRRPYRGMESHIPTWLNILLLQGVPDTTNLHYYTLLYVLWLSWDPSLYDDMRFWLGALVASADSRAVGPSTASDSDCTNTLQPVSGTCLGRVRTFPRHTDLGPIRISPYSLDLLQGTLELAWSLHFWDYSISFMCSAQLKNILLKASDIIYLTRVCSTQYTLTNRTIFIQVGHWYFSNTVQPGHCSVKQPPSYQITYLHAKL